MIMWFGTSEASSITASCDKSPAVDSAGNPLTKPDGTPINTTISRWGDYVHLRIAYPETRMFGAFGYAVLADGTAKTGDKNRSFLY